MSRRIYLASSWKNALYPGVLEQLRLGGHLVYDFRNPATGNTGFSWSQCTDMPWPWTIEQYREVLAHPAAQRGFGFDRTGLEWCDTCVLLNPCGLSAHMEFGFAAGSDKECFVVGLPKEPELMYLLGGYATTIVGADAMVLMATAEELLARIARGDEERQAWQKRVDDQHIQRGRGRG